MCKIKVPIFVPRNRCNLVKSIPKGRIEFLDLITFALVHNLVIDALKKLGTYPQEFSKLHPSAKCHSYYLLFSSGPARYFFCFDNISIMTLKVDILKSPYDIFS